MFKKNHLYYALPAVLVSTLAVIAIVFAWQEPGDVPPLDNVPAPVNVGSYFQSKSGPLTVRGQFIAATSTFLATDGGRVGIGTINPGVGHSEPNNVGLDVNNQIITGVKVPVDPSDAVPKSYVDAHTGGGGTSLVSAYVSGIGATADFPKRAFVTNQTWTGNLGGLAGADSKCQDSANAAGLGGTWKAWLSVPGSDARDRIKSGFYRIVGTAATYNDGLEYYQLVLLFPYGSYGNILRRLDKSETGQELGNVPVWTGTNAAGVRSGVNHCEGWTSSSDARTALVGQAAYVDGRFTDMGLDATLLRCHLNRRLYCFED